MSGESVYPWGTNSWADGSWGIQIDTITSHVSPVHSSVKTENTSLSLIDFDLRYDAVELAWYTNWFHATNITGREYDLAVQALPAPDAEDPVATINVEWVHTLDNITYKVSWGGGSWGDGAWGAYEKGGIIDEIGSVDYRSDPITVVGDTQVYDVTGVPETDDGYYRLRISDYGGYNDIQNINIGLIH